MKKTFFAAILLSAWSFVLPTRTDMQLEKFTIDLNVKKTTTPVRRKLTPEWKVLPDDGVKRAAFKLQNIIFKVSGVQSPILNEPLSPVSAAAAVTCISAMV